MADREPQKCPSCDHPRTSHSTQGYLHDGGCVYGCTKTYMDLSPKKK